MNQSPKSSVLPIRIGKDDNTEFKGTGFIIHSSQDATYIITCWHVIEDFKENEGEQIKAGNFDAKLFDSGKDYGLDLAILKIPQRLYDDQGNDLPVLNLCKSGNKEKIISILGWIEHVDKLGQIVQRPIEGELGSEINFNNDKSKNIYIPAWDLVIHEPHYQLQPGYSGSPVIDKETNYVLGIASSREGFGKWGQAIAVENIELLTKFCKDLVGYLFFKESDGNEPKPGGGNQEKIKDKQFEKTPGIIIHSVIPQEEKPQPKPDLTAHLNSVTRAITRGTLVPFLGPGINLCDRSNNHKKPDPSDWEPSGDYPPTRSELAIFLERKLFHGRSLTGVQCPLWESEKYDLPKECPIINRTMLTRLLFQHVSQFGESGKRDSAVEKAINDISTKRYTPNQFHNFFAQLPRILSQKGYQTPRLIVTANFDRTLEVAFQSKKQEFDLVYYFGRNVSSNKKFVHQKFRKNDIGQIKGDGEELIRDPNRYDKLDPDKYPVILKLYGPVGGTSDPTENFVITEDHFIDYLAQSNISEQLPSGLLEVLHDSKILFLGYGLSHWDERVVLHRIWPKDEYSIEEQDCWAIQSEQKALDEQLWNQAGVEPIWTSLEYYIAELKQRVYVAELKQRVEDLEEKR